MLEIQGIKMEIQRLFFEFQRLKLEIQQLIFEFQTHLLEGKKKNEIQRLNLKFQLEN